jgi:hypothetical protein
MAVAMPTVAQAWEVAAAQLFGSRQKLDRKERKDQADTQK